MRAARRLTIFAAVCAFSAAPASATLDIQRAFLAKYPKAKASLGKCTTCHTVQVPKKGSPQVNPYGTALMEKACTDPKAKTFDFSKVEALDSDGDGVSNLAEIGAGTRPGDATSK